MVVGPRFDYAADAVYSRGAETARRNEKIVIWLGVCAKNRGMISSNVSFENVGGSQIDATSPRLAHAFWQPRNAFGNRCAAGQIPFRHRSYNVSMTRDASSQAVPSTRYRREPHRRDSCQRSTFRLRDVGVPGVPFESNEVLAPETDRLFRLDISQRRSHWHSHRCRPPNPPSVPKRAFLQPSCQVPRLSW